MPLMRSKLSQAARLVEPLQLVFLAPQLVVVEAGPQLLDVPGEAVSDRLVDVDDMLRPDLLVGRHQLVELVPLAVRGRLVTRMRWPAEMTGKSEPQISRDFWWRANSSRNTFAE